MLATMNTENRQLMPKATPWFTEFRLQTAARENRAPPDRVPTLRYCNAAGLLFQIREGSFYAILTFASRPTPFLRRKRTVAHRST